MCRLIVLNLDALQHAVIFNRRGHGVAGIDLKDSLPQYAAFYRKPHHRVFRNNQLIWCADCDNGFDRMVSKFRSNVHAPNRTDTNSVDRHWRA